MPGTVSINRRTQVVTLYQGDDRAAIYDADADVKAAERDLRQAERVAAMARAEAEEGPSRIGDGVVEDSADLLAAREAVTAARAARDALIDDATPRAVVLTMAALKRLEFRVLMDEAQPPREGNAEDKEVGADLSKLADPLVMRCLTSPSMSDHEKSEFLEELSEADFNELFRAAAYLNLATGADPKALRASRGTS